MQDYTKLQVWNRSRDLIVKIYELTKKLPNSEQHGLINQLRRACISIAANIAEGASRSSSKEFSHFLSISICSTSEVESYIWLIHDLEFIKDFNHNNLIVEIVRLRKMLIVLRSRLKTQNS